MEGGGDWLAQDEIYHVLFCFSISLVFSQLATRSRYPFLKHRSICVGSIVSLAASAVKELADEFVFFKSAGASSIDTITDLFGVLLIVFSLSLCSASQTC